MKTTTTLILALALSLTAKANGFEKAMCEALSQMDSAQTTAQILETANTFGRIAGTAQAEWLPRYYATQCYIQMGFNSKLEAATRDEYLDLAQSFVDEAMKLKADLSEMYALQAMLHTARLVIDPMSRGQQMMAQSAKALAISLELNPNNPRATYLQLSNEIGQAKFFGKDVSVFCPRINGLYASWDELNKVPDLYPSWGKEDVAQLRKMCAE